MTKKRRSALKAHFPSSLEDEGDLVYEIEQDIVKFIVGNMMFILKEQDESDVEYEIEDEHLFNGMDENKTQLIQQR